ncbi:MAG: symmetrical bis(5'-nucleosyl)-tetraphosphatase [Halioglobus sp.]|nr:symmetrical bis(5'-nucleosyl)-tetraphosphatase [Halioglobus sp.]
MSTYVIGDIQGCLQPLKCLLNAVQFSHDQDVLWSVGDIVNRGPESLESLRFLYHMRDNLTVVLGNHDLHLLAIAAGVRRPSRSDTFDEILNAPDRQELLEWLAQQPLIHHEYGHTLVHAGIPPQWTLSQAMDYAREVESALRGSHATTFLGAMYGDEPAIWKEDLSGMTRLRVITNYLTRMRYCTRAGRLDFQNKGSSPALDTPKSDHQTVDAWFNHHDRKTAKDRILFGHWASIAGQTNNPNAIGLDTGCVWNGVMSLYHLESGDVTHCACQDGVCHDQPATRES